MIDGRGYTMSKALKLLLEKVKKIAMTPAQKEEQRRSFAYGNTKIENPRITRQVVNKQAEAMRQR